MTGTVVTHYEVLERLGRGGMGVVYKARDQRLGRMVALKFLPPHIVAGDSTKRFVLEAQAASALEHPNICTIYEFDETADGQMFIAMAFYEGETVQKKLALGRLPVGQALDIAVQAARGLSKAHENGIIHRDINPANLIVTPDGVVKVLDFGAAMISGTTRLTRVGMTLGTLPYMSPEQVKGEREVDPRADIWSLGVVLYEMLAGHLPFDEEYDQSLIYAILSEEPQSVCSLRPELPDEFELIQQKTLAKEMPERYESMRDFQADLERLQRQWDDTLQGERLQPTQPVRSAVKTAPRKPSAASPRMWAPIAFAIVTVVVAVCAFVEPIRVRLLSLGCEWAPDTLSYCRIPEFRHISVMPFTGSPEGDDGSLAAGLSSSLMHQLDRLEKFAPTLCIHGARGDRPEFGVNLLAAGSLQQQGEQMKLRIDLINAANSAVMRSQPVEAFQSNVSLLQEIEDGLVEKLAGTLQIDLPHEALTFATAGGTGIPAAYLAYIKGLGSLQQNKLEPAVSFFEQALGQDAYYPLAHAALGETCWRLFNQNHETSWRDRAQQGFEKAIERSDQLPEVHVGLGRIYAGAGRNDDAIREFQRALELDPQHTEARIELVVAYQAERRLDEAKAVYDQGIESRPGCWYKYHMLGLLYLRNGCYERAEQQYKKVVELSPRNRLAFTNLSAVYLHSDRLEDAEAVLRRLLEIDKSPSAYLNLANVYFRQRRYADAARQVDAAIQMGSDKNQSSGNRAEYQVWGNRAETYNMVPQLQDRAPALFQRAIELAKVELSKDRFNAEAWAMLGNHHARLNEFNEARDAIDTALKIAPKNLNVLFRASLVFEMMGDRQNALDSLRKALLGGYSLEEIRQSEPLDELRKTPEYSKIEQEALAARPETPCPISS